MKLSIGAVALVAVLGGPLVAAAQEAELSANVGWASEYFYRGIFQKASSASAGLDLAVSKVYLGAWAADVGDGNEVDVYAGVGTEVNDFSVSIGGTGYFYTGDFDQTYLEGNLNAAYNVISAEFSYGRHDLVQADPADPENETYWYLAGTVEKWGLYGTYGTFGKDLDFDYFEGGYGVSVGDLDLSAAWVYGIKGADDHTLVFSISHTFGIDIN